MTDEQFARLAKFEYQFKTATRHDYVRFPGTLRMSEMVEVYNEITGSKLKVGCQSCGSTSVTKKVAKLYYQEKERRQVEELEKKVDIKWTENPTSDELLNDIDKALNSVDNILSPPKKRTTRKKKEV